VLRDIHLPPAHWWPPAPGWWLLAVVLLLAAGGIAWWLWRSRLGAPIRAALREIDALEAAHACDGNPAVLADGASRLMRRVALRVAPDAAAQTGAAWHAFVLAHAPDENARHALGELAGERCRAQPALDAPNLFAVLRAWCRNALSARPSAAFRGKGAALQAPGDETGEAKAIPRSAVARVRASFPGGKQIPPGSRAVAPQARREPSMHSTPRDPTP
jgi:hypothetical protein